MTAAAATRSADWIAAARKSLVFDGFSRREIEEVTRRLPQHVRPFDRGESLITDGPGCTVAGVVLDGAAFSLALAADGTHHLVAALGPGAAFTDCRLAHGAARSPFCVVGAQPGRVLLIGTDRIVLAQEPLCRLQCRLAENLLRVAADHGQAMADKLAVVGTRSLRARIALFLEQQTSRHGQREFSVAFSRAELADYLGADRTALSRELSRMRDEGLIDFHRSSFVILDRREAVAD